jgi:REP element-mobilizing transposase RayT
LYSLKAASPIFNQFKAVSSLFAQSSLLIYLLKAASPPRVTTMTFSSINHDTNLYFITASICGWKHLFVESTYADIVLRSLVWLRREQRMSLFAYVLMPSHLHAIVKPTGRTIGELLQNFGSYTAHAILKQLRCDSRHDLLQFFHEQRRYGHIQHSIWQDIQAKNIFSRQVLVQKLEYIHNNPVDKDWHLVDERADYTNSSACFYDKGIQSVVAVDDVREWL